MPKGKELRSRLFAIDPRFRYLPDQDRYLFALDKAKYKFNVIGAGIIGQEHIRVTLLEGRATIHGVYDPNPRSLEAAQQEFSTYSPEGQIKIYASLEEACIDPAVDGLLICTPNYTHIGVVRVAAKSGKHILLEKPMATTLQDAYEIMQLANSYESVFQIGLQYRHKAIYTEAIYESLTRRTIGDIKAISLLEHRFPFIDKVNQWNKFFKYSGGTLVEKCCHYFDLLNLFAQSRLVSVYASGSMAVNFVEFEYGAEKSDIIDNATVIINYENGIHANFNLCMFAPMYYEELIICGNEGRLKAFENRDFLSQSRDTNYLEIICGDDRPSRSSIPSYPKFIEESGHNGATYYEHVKFVDNIEGKETNAASAEEGFWSVVVGIAAEESVKTGQVVNINEMLDRNGIKL